MTGGGPASRVGASLGDAQRGVAAAKGGAARGVPTSSGEDDFSLFFVIVAEEEQPFLFLIAAIAPFPSKEASSMCGPKV